MEMGLHPRAIAVVMLMVFELMARGYRVCISTHSPQVLDAVWASDGSGIMEPPPPACCRCSIWRQRQEWWSSPRKL